MVQPQAFDSQKRWYDEYLAMAETANRIATENAVLGQRIGELERRLLAVDLTPECIGDLGSPDLARLAHHYQGLLTAIVVELRARHVDIAGDLIAPRVHALEDELAAARERIWDWASRLHDLERTQSRQNGRHYPSTRQPM